jgi:flagellar biosynthetic protein FlhB
MAEQEQNRTEQATPFKLEEARKQGQVPKSLDFNTLVMMAGLIGMAAIWATVAWGELGAVWRELFAGAGSLAVTPEGGIPWLGGVLMTFLRLIAPILGVGVVLAVLANFVQTGPIFSFEPLKPKSERINPVAGFKRIYNVKLLFEAFKGVLKLVFLGGVAVAFMFAIWPTMPEAQTHDAVQVQSWFGEHAMSLLFRLGLALLVIGLMDLAFTKYRYSKQMMMSRRELKDEVKRREGDPLIRAKLRELQRENIKQAASIKRVPEADVLITNPEHLAIALRYDRNTMAAPELLAKGADSWAADMRSLAARHSVRIYENKPLARLLFRKGLVGQPIPPDSYLDVARIYADLEAKQRGLVEYEVRG